MFGRVKSGESLGMIGRFGVCESAMLWLDGRRKIRCNNIGQVIGRKVTGRGCSRRRKGNNRILLSRHGTVFRVRINRSGFTCI